MDEISHDNRTRWNALVDANVDYTRPFLDLSPATARRLLDPHNVMGDVHDANVLCLAAGGGQQSVAFALLGAHVTVHDLSDNQLQRDRAAAQHYGLDIQTRQGDMRDLSPYDDGAFDVVYQAYSINFVPSVVPVFAEVARVLKPGGPFRIEWANPFVQTMDPDVDWNGEGYLLRHPYVDGREVTELFPTWTVDQEDGIPQTLESPHEFVHTLSTLTNTLVAHRFVILHCSEDTGSEPDAAPGTWAHSMRVAPPYLTLWARYAPTGFGEVHWPHPPWTEDA